MTGVDMKRILFGIASAFIIGIMLGLLHPLPIQPQKHHISLRNRQPETGVIVPALAIKVYDDQGNLKYAYAKVGDLPTKNFLKWLMHTWWYSSTSIQIYNATWTSEDGASGSPATGYTHGGGSATVAGVSGITLKVALGNGTTTPTIDDYALESKLVEVPVTWYAFDANSTHMWIEVKATYTATSPINITEIGLLGIMYDAIGTTNKWMLLFRDVVPQISLDVDQTLEVRYYVYVRYG